jgi:superfamily II RNA helicase
MEFFRNSVVAIEFKSSRIAAFKMLSNGSQTLRSRFHPLVQKWFESKFKQPTEIQEKAWELIAAGEHSLISAATGSGKTLAAFLWAIDQLASGKWELGQTRVLYISPLKALNNDIRRNLLEPLTELKDSFEREGLAWPNIRVIFWKRRCFRRLLRSEILKPFGLSSRPWMCWRK